MNHLLSRISGFNEWGRCKALELLHAYEPDTSDEDEVFEVMVCDVDIFVPVSTFLLYY